MICNLTIYKIKLINSIKIFMINFIIGIMQVLINAVLNLHP